MTLDAKFTYLPGNEALVSCLPLSMCTDRQAGQINKTPFGLRSIPPVKHEKICIFISLSLLPRKPGRTLIDKPRGKVENFLEAML